MSRRGRIAAVVVLVVGVVAGATAVVLWRASPHATAGLDYSDLDAAGMADVTVVVAASRPDTTAVGMQGSTLLVDRHGNVRRVDNEGVDQVSLATDGAVVGFAGEGNDYLLGTGRPVQPRSSPTKASVYGSYLREGRLVTLLNGGFGERGYELGVADSEAGTRTDHGYLMASAQCADGVWALTVPDVEAVSRNATILLRRVEPDGGRRWTIDAGAGELSFDSAVCAGRRLVAAGTIAESEAVVRRVLATVDVRAGAVRLVDIDRPPFNPLEPDASWSESVTMVGVDAAVIERPFGRVDHGELWRINRATGGVERIRTFTGSDESSELLFRFDGDLLYVLDVTRDAPSVLTAYSVRDGAQLGRRTMEALDNRLNGPFTSFDASKFVGDFVVLQGPDQW